MCNGRHVSRTCSTLAGMPRPSCPLRSDVASELSRKGWELQRDGESSTALACHKRAASLDPDNIYVHFHLAQTETSLGLTRDAVRAMDAQRTLPLPLASFSVLAYNSLHTAEGMLESLAGLLA